MVSNKISRKIFGWYETLKRQLIANDLNNYIEIDIKSSEMNRSQIKFDNAAQINLTNNIDNLTNVNYKNNKNIIYPNGDFDLDENLCTYMTN
ncbi:hypothetical protein H8356DRAFT_1335484 [Neocallimastix lanati (nom. inval.)]|nr:hypothetical protein H8356DRAFT_1335484 [Neocallimastix sp. JGI-2020a]